VLKKKIFRYANLPPLPPTFQILEISLLVWSPDEGNACL